MLCFIMRTVRKVMCHINVCPEKMLVKRSVFACKEIIKKDKEKIMQNQTAFH